MRDRKTDNHYCILKLRLTCIYIDADAHETRHESCSYRRCCADDAAADNTAAALRRQRRRLERRFERRGRRERLRRRPQLCDALARRQWRVVIVYQTSMQSRLAGVVARFDVDAALDDGVEEQFAIATRRALAEQMQRRVAELVAHVRQHACERQHTNQHLV